MSSRWSRSYPDRRRRQTAAPASKRTIVAASSVEIPGSEESCPAPVFGSIFTAMPPDAPAPGAVGWDGLAGPPPGCVGAGFVVAIGVAAPGPDVAVGSGGAASSSSRLAFAV